MARFLYSNDTLQEEPAFPCAEKLVFDTLRQAQAAANVAEYQHGAKVAPYECRYCGLWHLSSV
jgi:hypothetical protein